MSFTFNFDEGGNESEEKVYSNQQIVEGQINTNSSSSPPSSSSCRELTYTTNITYEEIQARCRVAKVIITNDFEFQFTLSFDSTDCKGYDLVPGKYEGGGKLWECSVDLARYIFKNIESLRSYSYGCCLELGCGHGLPGIICMKSLGLDVSFSDFNIEVLQNHTWPNIILNISHSADEIRPRARFFAGDWKASSDTYFQNTYFSFILTAETLYTEEHCVQV